MRALITGITGFVGGHLVEHLAERGDVIAGFSRSGRWPAELAHLSGRARVEACDIELESEAALADRIARKSPEVIYHLAAQANPHASLADPRGTWALNLGGALNLFEAVRKTEQSPRIVLVGSGVCYGNPREEDLPVSESCPLRPNNPYAASKAAADLLGIQHHLAHGTNVVMVRPFNHAGPRQSTSYVLAAMARQVAEVEAGRKTHIDVGNLDVVRDFTDVRDVVRGYRALAERGDAGQIFNLGAGAGVKLKDALETLRSLARTTVEIRVDPARMRPVDQPLLVANAAKLRTATGWKPQFSIEQTLSDMLEHARTQLAN